MRLSSYIGWRFLHAKRERSMLGLLAWVSLGGVVLGVATLVVSTTVLESFRNQLLEVTFGINGHAWIKGEEPLTTKEVAILTKKFNELEQVYSVESYVLREAFLQHNGGEFEAIKLKGLQWAEADGGIQIPSEGSERIPTNSKNMAANLSKRVRVNPLWFGGRNGKGIAALKDSGSVLLSTSLAQKWDLEIGDSVQLISTATRTTPLGALPFVKRFTLEGVIESGIENALAVISIGDARNLYGLGDRVDGVALQLENPLQLELAPLQTVATGYQVSSWADVYQSLFRVMKLERLGLWLVLSLIVLVSMVNISASLAMMVQDKRGALAVLKTLGSSRGLVGTVFVRQGIWIGLLGSIAGLALGMLFSVGFVVWANKYLSESFSELFLSWDWWGMFWLAVSVTALGILTGLWAARYAVRDEPADVLREC